MVDNAVLIDATQGEDGAFRILGVPDGSWRVVAYTSVGEKYFAKTVSASPGDTVEIDLTKN